MALDTTIGGASSDSYATLAEYQAYLAAIGLSPTGVDATDEQNLRRARQYLDRSYSWLGYKVNSTQRLSWPRTIGEYIDGYPVQPTEIPQPIKDAQCEMAYLIQGGADPFETLTGGAVKRKREKVDVVEEETEYSSTRDRDAYPAVDQLVSSYATGKAGSMPFSVGLSRV